MVRTHPSIGALVANVILVLPSPYHTKRGGEEGRRCREQVDVKEAIATRQVHTYFCACTLITYMTTTMTITIPMTTTRTIATIIPPAMAAIFPSSGSEGKGVGQDSEQSE